VVSPRPLRLRAQVAKAEPLTVASHLPIAKILVDTGVFHLDSPYDYEIPEQFSHLDLIGRRVQVEFGHALHEGIVIERVSVSQGTRGLKQINKILSPHCVLPTQMFALINAVAQRWASSPYDVIRSAIPPRVASVDKEAFEAEAHIEITTSTTQIPKVLKSSSIRSYWMLPSSQPVCRLLAELALERSRFGQVLVVVPDERSLSELLTHLQEVYPGMVARLDGHHNRSDRYRDYLRMVKGVARIGVGLRGSIFTPLLNNATVVVSEDTSEHYYENRSPGWNVRDVALLRAQISHLNVIFTGFTPSLEVGRLIDSGWFSLVASSKRMNVLAVDANFGELLPSKIFSVVRKGLKSGPVLFLVPRKGYGNAILCRKCKNVSICECGGRLAKNGKTAAPECVLCLRVYEPWKCTYCQSEEIHVAARGIDRFSEEIGRAFANYPIVNSTADHLVDDVTGAPALILATHGAQPNVKGGYSAVILLEGIRFFGHTHMRSQESARELFFASASLVSEGGQIAVVIDPSHPIVGALTRWNSAPMIRKELKEREELQLPPFYRFVIIESSTREATLIKNGFVAAVQDGRLPSSTKVIGPHAASTDSSRLSLAVAVGEADQLISFVHELQRRRNISRKNLLVLRVDPYSLS